MAQDDDRNTTSGSSRPGRQPPVIDLKAEDVDKSTSPDASASGEADPSAPASTVAEQIETQAAAESQAEAAGDDVGLTARKSPFDEEPAAQEETTDMPEPEETPALAPRERPSEIASALRGGIGALLLMTGVLGGLLIYRYYGSDYFPTPQMTEVLAKLPAMEQTSRENRDRLDTFSETVESFKSRLSSLEEGTAAIRQGLGNLQATVDDTRNLAQRANAAATEAKDQASSTGGQAAVDLAPLQSDIATINDRLSALENQLGAMREQLSRDDMSSEATQSLVSRLEALEAKIEGRLQEQAQEAAQQAERAATIAGALDDLRDKLASGQPYNGAIDQLRGAVDTSEAFHQLAAFAQTGVPTRQTLIQRFDDVRQALANARPQEVSTPEQGSWAALVNRLKQVVQVRPVGEVDWAEVAGRMAGPVQAGDLDAAVQIAQSAGGTPPQQLAAWIDAVRVRKNMDESMAALTTQVLGQLRLSPSSGN